MPGGIRVAVENPSDAATFTVTEANTADRRAVTVDSVEQTLAALISRLGRRCRAEVHGQVLGSGLEMAAFCGWVRADPQATLGPPELALGLIPGAGDTVSITRRVGRWRTAYLVLTGRTIDAETALDWGLVDEILSR